MSRSGSSMYIGKSLQGILEDVGPILNAWRRFDRGTNAHMAHNGGISSVLQIAASKVPHSDFVNIVGLSSL